MHFGVSSDRASAAVPPPESSALSCHGSCHNSYNIRKLTPNEGLKLQGFDTEFFVNTNKAGVSNTQLYKQIGNAISVNVAYGIIHYLKTKKVGIFR